MNQNTATAKNEMVVSVPDFSKPFEKFLKKFKEEIQSGIDAANTVGDKKFKCLCKALEDLVLIIETGNSKFEFNTKKNMTAEFISAKRKKISLYRDKFLIRVMFLLIENNEQDFKDIENVFKSIVLIFIRKFVEEKNYTFETQLNAFQKKIIETGALVTSGWQDGQMS
jgi:hypothetical protein